jgi:hypothetical protein
MHPNGQIQLMNGTCDVNPCIPGQFGMFTKRQKTELAKEIPILEKAFKTPDQLYLVG